MNPIWTKLYDAAKSVLKERRISKYVTAGEVAAAILSKSGNAIFNMITNGEQEIEKVLCILPDGSNGAPCGACRELMVQLMPNNYQDIEIMLDYATERIVKLGALTPEWWI